MTWLITAEELSTQGIRIGALVLLAGLVTLLAAVAFRWYVREELPQGVGLLLGATGIAVVLNTTASLGQSIGGTTELLDAQTAAFTVLTFLLGGVASEAGRRVGGHLGARLDPGGTLGGFDWELTSFVRGGGRLLRVHIPEVIHDIDGYDPVRADIKSELAGESMTFPGRMTHDELHEAFTARLVSELGIGKVDVEFTDDGELTYLALGRGEAGVGHTLQPGQVAVAIEADPANSASPGDQVTVIRRDEAPERLLTGEVRGVSGDIVTIAVDADEAELLAETDRYRLVTRPDTVEPGREFATLLRHSNESSVDLTVEPSAELVGQAVSTLEVTVLIVTADDQRYAPPPPAYRLAAGDDLVAIGRPDALRRFTTMAQGTSP